MNFFKTYLRLDWIKVEKGIHTSFTVYFSGLNLFLVF